jgi:broad specificity phosphatase PhoE
MAGSGGGKSMRPNRIILIRHGESEGNVDKNHYQFTPDYALNLTQKGIEQAQRAGQEIKNIIGSESLYAYISPYLRTRQTYQGLSAALTVNITRVIEDPRIREQDWGHLRHPDDNEEIIQKRD